MASQTAERLAVAQIAEQVERPVAPLFDINRVASLANLVQFGYQQVPGPSFN